MYKSNGGRRRYDGRYNEPTRLILFNDKPLTLHWRLSYIDAILDAYWSCFCFGFLTVKQELLLVILQCRIIVTRNGVVGASRALVSKDMHYVVYRISLITVLLIKLEIVTTQQDSQCCEVSMTTTHIEIIIICSPP